MKAWGRFLAAVGAVLFLFAMPAGAPAASRAHRRHIEVREPSSHALLVVGERDGYEIVVSFEEPDIAILRVGTCDDDTGAATLTDYGAHFKGSLPAGRLRARIGSVGSISVEFRPAGKGRSWKPEGNCTGRDGREEFGHFVGHISLQGEGDYFHVEAERLTGTLARSFRLRCRVKRRRIPYPPESLREAVVPQVPIPFAGGGSLASLQVAGREHGREIGLRVDHFAGAPPGADVQLVEREYQGEMPVGRGASIEASPAGTLLTTLPGERPPRATLRPPAPFSGEAEYLGSSLVSHGWTGTLAVQLPGLLLPLTGPGLAGSLCVATAIGSGPGCDSAPPDRQRAEVSSGPARGVG